MVAKLLTKSPSFNPVHAHTGQLKALERRLHERLDACCTQLEALGQALGDVARMEKPDSKNPFAGRSCVCLQGGWCRGDGGHGCTHFCTKGNPRRIH